MSSKKVAFYTLGCKLNFSETSTLAREFEECGFEKVSPQSVADIYVINSCSVTDHSDKKCRNIIRKLHKLNPDSIIAVTGCYAQLKPSEIAQIEGVDIVIGNNEKGSLVDLVRNIPSKGTATIHTCETSELTSFFASFSTGDRTRAFLKVQDGCDYRCSYCTIPLARGASRNISIEEAVKHAKAIVAKGQKEIVITGINTGDFGKTTGEKFIDLIRELDKIDGIERFRISSIEPNLLTDDIIEFCRDSKKFQPHFHIPLQSGSDKILGLMKRRYNTEKFRDRIDKVRELMGDVFIGIDLICGFPGESEVEFEESLNFIKSINPSFLHIFPYSLRPNTPAIEFNGKVSPAESNRRVKLFSELSDKFYVDYASKFIDNEALVLFESSRKDGKIFGFTENYLKVETPYDKTLVNKICKVKLTELTENGNIKCEVLKN